MGWLIYLNDALVGWNSKAMNCVTLSLTEAEYVSMSVGFKALKFIYMLVFHSSIKYLKYIGANLIIPIIQSHHMFDFKDIYKEDVRSTFF